MNHRVEKTGRWMFAAMIALVSAAGATESTRAQSERIEIREGLAAQQPFGAGRGRAGARSAIYSDPLEHRLVLEGASSMTPKEGDIALEREGEPVHWQKAAILERARVGFRGNEREVTNTWVVGPFEEGENGVPSARPLFGGWVYAPVELEQDQLMLVEATGFAVVYVNGEPRGGAIYGADFGMTAHPVQLRKGTNHLLFEGVRNSFQARLVPAEAPVSLTTADMTAPDLLIGDNQVVWVGMRVINGTDRFIKGAAIEATVEGGRTLRTELPAIAPMTTRKVPFKVAPAPNTEPGRAAVSVKLEWPEGHLTGDARPSESFHLAVKSPEAHHSTTFLSDIDGSVQYYGVSPGAIEGDAKPALFVSLHGAAVHADNQARQYSPKTWGHLVAPTNRRPYGFDWEDWGRLDALEVFELAKERFKPDPQRIYLTGHSMGGHGTWHLGVTFPAKWAAIAPSAGWYSFWSYGGKERYDSAPPLEQVIMRAAAGSDTEALARNYLHHGIYILHGDADDNVPVDQARHMRKLLAEFHPDFAYYERPGAGHWWGSACVDWPAIFEFFQARTIPTPAEARRIEFVTANPGVSATSHWVTIETQQRALVFSKVVIEQNVGERTFKGTTENVERLSLDVARLAPEGEVKIELDGQSIAAPYPTGEGRVYLARNGEGAWSLADKASPKHKGPHRAGPFKDAFRHRMMFVYGTGGTPQENDWAYQKARLDAEIFWYRGNGAIDIVPDSAFTLESTRDRGVILYGHAEMNSAWDRLLGDSPVRVQRGSVTVDGRTMRGEDLGTHFVRPRPDSDAACVAVIAGTGMPGMRLLHNQRYFVSGTGYPDWMILHTDMLRDGEAGVIAAGYFGNDWSVQTGESHWRDAQSTTDAAHDPRP